MAHYHTKLLILGSGPAGYSAAIYASRSNLSPILVQGMQPGGQLTITTDVENYPGFEETIQGPWLMEQMEKQAARFGTVLKYDHIKEVDFTKKPFECSGESGDSYTADAVIICMGAQARWLNLESESYYQGYGVSGCATCDAFFFKNKKVVVVGGGNSAVEEALYLTHHASHVTLIHRRDQLRAEKIMQERLFAHPKISVIFDHHVEEILGTKDPKNVTSMRIKHVKTQESQEIEVDGVFIAIGHTPNTGLFKEYLHLDEDHYIITEPGTTKTNIPGVFAAGDVQDKHYRQAITAAGTGCMASLDAQKYLDALPTHSD